MDDNMFCIICSERSAVMQALTEVHIIEDTMQTNAPMFKLQEDFKQNLRIAIAGGWMFN